MHGHFAVMKLDMSHSKTSLMGECGVWFAGVLEVDTATALS